ncbi:hypothetical protein D9M71_801170 [compost metagenome]
MLIRHIELVRAAHNNFMVAEILQVSVSACVEELSGFDWIQQVFPLTDLVIKFNLYGVLSNLLVLLP